VERENEPHLLFTKSRLLLAGGIFAIRQEEKMV
jgi:hypothetical protein